MKPELTGSPARLGVKYGRKKVKDDPTDLGLGTARTQMPLLGEERFGVGKIRSSVWDMLSLRGPLSTYLSKMGRRQLDIGVWSSGKESS